MRSVLLSLNLLLIAGCVRRDPTPSDAESAPKASRPPAIAGRPPEPDVAVMMRAHGVLGPFKVKLKQALEAGLAQSPVKAIEACQLQAPAIAAGLARDGVTIGRTSDKLRNPKNTRPSWLSASDYAALAKVASKVIVIDDDRVGYVEAIKAQALCLTCHGEQRAPEIDAALKQRYPQDKAIGYREGDLRGAFWVELPRVK